MQIQMPTDWLQHKQRRKEFLLSTYTNKTSPIISKANYKHAVDAIRSNNKVYETLWRDSSQQKLQLNVQDPHKQSVSVLLPADVNTVDAYI